MAAEENQYNRVRELSERQCNVNEIGERTAATATVAVITHNICLLLAIIVASTEAACVHSDYQSRRIASNLLIEWQTNRHGRFNLHYGQAMAPLMMMPSTSLILSGRQGTRR